MGVLVYNGLRSLDYGIVVEHPPVFTYPERVYEKVHVPGRNGDIIVDTGSYNNVKAKYDISFGSYKKKYTELAHSVSTWLHSALGSYARLEDSYDPEHFRLAAYLEENEFENLFMQGGRASIEFDCKPQKFLKTGEKPIAINKTGATVLNPTIHTALPLIKIYGSSSGTVVVNGVRITISEIENGLVVDSDVEDVYLGTVNKNPVATMPDGFPTLKKGENSISFTGGVTRLEVTPRWWTL